MEIRLQNVSTYEFIIGTLIALVPGYFIFFSTYYFDSWLKLDWTFALPTLENIEERLIMMFIYIIMVFLLYAACIPFNVKED